MNKTTWQEKVEERQKQEPKAPKVIFLLDTNERVYRWPK